GLVAVLHRVDAVRRRARMRAAGADAARAVAGERAELPGVADGAVRAAAVDVGLGAVEDGVDAAERHAAVLPAHLAAAVAVVEALDAGAEAVAELAAVIGAVDAGRARHVDREALAASVDGAAVHVVEDVAHVRLA